MTPPPTTQTQARRFLCTKSPGTQGMGESNRRRHPRKEYEMTDRELLKDAAKAAGHVLVWGDKYKLGDDEIDCTDISYIRSGQPDEGDVFWNPLTDDGDALRLAVKLRKMPVIERWSDGHDWVFIPGHEGGALPLGNDHLAATRRAIVRAAAEIGRSMK